jgi:hypothetical protein
MTQQMDAKGPLKNVNQGSVSLLGAARFMVTAHSTACSFLGSGTSLSPRLR